MIGPTRIIPFLCFSQTEKGDDFCMEYDLFDYFLKWFIPFACAGLFGAIIVPIWNRYKCGRDAELKAKWNVYAQETKNDIEAFKNESKKKDIELEQKILNVQTTLVDKIEQNTAGIRQAILQSHLRELIIDGKMYLKNEYITLEQLADYEERFLTYKSLGGNGHVDPWIAKIRQLPNHPPVTAEETDISARQ